MTYRSVPSPRGAVTILLGSSLNRCERKSAGRAFFPFMIFVLILSFEKRKWNPPPAGPPRTPHFYEIGSNSDVRLPSATPILSRQPSCYSPRSSTFSGITVFPTDPIPPARAHAPQNRTTKCYQLCLPIYRRLWAYASQQEQTPRTQSRATRRTTGTPRRSPASTTAGASRC